MNRKYFALALMAFGLVLLVSGPGYAACGPANCVEVNTDAAMEGTYGLEVVLDGAVSTANAFVMDSTPDINQETTYRASFLFNLNDINAIVGGRHLVTSLSLLSSQGVRGFTLQVRKTAATWDVRVFTQTTAGNIRKSVIPIPIESNKTYRMTMEWQRSSGPGVADGFIRLTVADPNGANAVSRERSDILNWTQTARNMKLGHVGGSVDPDTNGSHYYDDFQSFRTLAP